MAYQLKNKVRIVTAASLFDGHDAAINIMRRLLQASGAEVIHLGHDRSVQEVVECAIQEDAHAVAVTSYQGGHMEYFKYMVDLFKEKGAAEIKIFGGGGGVILPEEIDALHACGVCRLYSPDDGRAMGLKGMIDDLLSRCDYAKTDGTERADLNKLRDKAPRTVSRLITMAENDPGQFHRTGSAVLAAANASAAPPVLGVTGTGGAGKSSLVDELIRRFLQSSEDKTVAIVSVDPTRRKSGGALLGDRIRMNSVYDPRVYMRSLATRQANLALSAHIQDVLSILRAARYDLIILESSGIGQSDSEMEAHADVSLYVMTPEYGAASQLEKIDMLDFADLIAINKFDKRGAEDALRDVRKQYKRNHCLFEAGDDEVPVFGTIASQFNDSSVTHLFNAILAKIEEKTAQRLGRPLPVHASHSLNGQLIPPKRVRYLSEIAETIRDYDQWVSEQCEIAHQLEALETTRKLLGDKGTPEEMTGIGAAENRLTQTLAPENKQSLKQWDALTDRYRQDTFSFTVRGNTVSLKTHRETLSHLKIPRVAPPRYRGGSDRLRWLLQENFPGHFPFTAGIFPFKREGEDPTRMFAGEGGPERTNRRFHYLSRDMPAKRLSTAFDSVTLYGNDPDYRPDIFGKVGNSGVSVCCLDDAKKLYSGFNLVDPKTSVSMTINGPAPIILSFFLNAAIDQQCERYIHEQGLTDQVKEKIRKIFEHGGHVQPAYQGPLPPGHDGLGLLLLGVTGDQVLPADVYHRIRSDTLKQVRGTVQADILKEDQAQNTCIFSTEFALKLMGDVQEYFIDHEIRNFYSVSISGYHMAEAGANPITQLAFTLANGFTFVEYYLSRGMAIDDFGPNLSFFFSNGVDAEYAVIGRVARRIWAKAMKLKYGANERSQKLKYHIQTSGRSLHAQEIDFNDIRTTLQALYAIYDNCNSLHTNAYDEAITTPTEDSVRRAMAIQLIINKEFGLAQNENPNQGAFIIETLTDLVEEAVLHEFDRLTERGGVLGAMETMYQRSRIQEESLYYESLKHSGAYPVIGVNTFLSAKGSPTVIPGEVVRSSDEEKKAQIELCRQLHARHAERAPGLLEDVKRAVFRNENVFESLMEAGKVCSLGQIVHALFEVGGRYRRNM